MTPQARNDNETALQLLLDSKDPLLANDPLGYEMDWVIVMVVNGQAMPPVIGQPLVKGEKILQQMRAFKMNRAEPNKLIRYEARPFRPMGA